MGTTLTIHERAKLEQRYVDMIDAGMTVAEMAEKLEVTQQAVRKFMKLRKWSLKPKT